MKLSRLNKRGFSTVNAIITGIASLAFALVFMFIVLTQLSSDSLTGTGTAADTAVDELIGNVSLGVDDVNAQIPTVFSIGAIVLIIGVLAILFVLGKRSGMFGGSQLS